MEYLRSVRCVLLIVLMCAGTKGRHAAGTRDINTAQINDHVENPASHEQNTPDFGYTNLLSRFSEPASNFGLQNIMNLMKLRPESSRTQHYGHSVPDAGASTNSEFNSKDPNNEIESYHVPSGNAGSHRPQGHVRQEHDLYYVDSNNVQKIPVARRRTVTVGGIHVNTDTKIVENENLEHLTNDQALISQPSLQNNVESRYVNSEHNGISQYSGHSSWSSINGKIEDTQGATEREIPLYACQRKQSLNWPIGSLGSSDITSDWSTGSSTKTTICPVFGPCPEECRTLMLSECPVCQCQGRDGILIHLNFFQTGYGSQISVFGNNNNKNENKDAATNTHNPDSDLATGDVISGFHGYSNVNSGGSIETNDPPVPHEMTTQGPTESDTTVTILNSSAAGTSALTQAPYKKLTTVESQMPEGATTSSPWSGTQQFPLMGGGTQQQTGNGIIGRTDFSTPTGAFPNQAQGGTGNSFMEGQDGNGMYGMMSGNFNGNSGGGQNEFGLSGQTGGTGMHQSQYGQNGAMSNGFNVLGNSGNIQPGIGPGSKSESGVGQTGIDPMSGFGIAAPQSNSMGSNTQNGFNANSEFGQPNYNGMQAQAATGVAGNGLNPGKSNTGSMGNPVPDNNFGSPVDFQSGFDFSKLLSQSSFNGPVSGFQYGSSTGSSTADSKNNQGPEGDNNQISKENGTSEGANDLPHPHRQEELPLKTQGGTTGEESKSKEQEGVGSVSLGSSGGSSSTKSEEPAQNLNGCSPFPKNCRMACLSIAAGGCIECMCKDSHIVEVTLGVQAVTQIPAATGSIYQQQQQLPQMVGMSANNNGCPSIPMNCNPVDLSMDASGCIICLRTSSDFSGRSTQKRNLPETNDETIAMVNTEEEEDSGIHGNTNNKNRNNTTQQQHNNDENNSENRIPTVETSTDSRDIIREGADINNNNGNKEQRRSNKNNNNRCPSFSNNCPIQCLSIDGLGCVVCSCPVSVQSLSMTSSYLTNNNNGCSPFPVSCSPSCPESDKMGCPICLRDIFELDARHLSLECVFEMKCWCPLDLIDDCERYEAVTKDGDCESGPYSQSISSASTLNLGGCKPFPQGCSPECTSLSSTGCPVCLPDCTEASVSTTNPVRTCPPLSDNCNAQCITHNAEGCAVCHCDERSSSSFTINTEASKIYGSSQPGDASTVTPVPHTEEQSTTSMEILQGETTPVIPNCPMFDMYCVVACIKLDSNNCLKCACNGEEQTQPVTPKLLNLAFITPTPKANLKTTNSNTGFRSTSSLSPKLSQATSIFLRTSQSVPTTTVLSTDLRDSTTTPQSTSSTPISDVTTLSPIDPFLGEAMASLGVSSQFPSLPPKFPTVSVKANQKSTEKSLKETTQSNEPKLLTSTFKPNDLLKVPDSTVNPDNVYTSKVLTVLKSSTPSNILTNPTSANAVVQSTSTTQMSINNEMATTSADRLASKNSELNSLIKELTELKEAAVTMEMNKPTTDTSQPTTLKGCPMFDLSCPVDCAIVDGMGCLVCHCASTAPSFLTSTPQQDKSSQEPLSFSKRVPEYTSLQSTETLKDTKTVGITSRSTTVSSQEPLRSSFAHRTKTTLVPSSPLSHSTPSTTSSQAIMWSSPLFQLLNTSRPPSFSSSESSPSASSPESTSAGISPKNSEHPSVGSTRATERSSEPLGSTTVDRLSTPLPTQPLEQVPTQTSPLDLGLSSTLTSASTTQGKSQVTSTPTHQMMTCPPTRCVFPCDAGITLGVDNCPICLCRRITTSLP